MARFLLVIFCCCFCFLAKAQKPLVTYKNIYDKNSDGQPSRCDCDYRLKQLDLNPDSTFVLEEIKGRLDPEEQLSETGTWKIERDTLLVLTVKTSTAFLLNEKKERELLTYRKTFILKKWNIWHYDEEWEGSALLNRKP